MNDLGDIVVVWAQKYGNNDAIFMSEYRGGLWHHPLSLADQISPEDTLSQKPQVAINQAGEAIVVWMQRSGVLDRIFMSEYR
jgi:hypothetical protein